jgi:hypothetical protein
MLRNRLIIVLGACFLAASGAWADEIGFVDCSKGGDATQVFGKPRRSPDVVGSLPCGERFTILVYGFYFSRIQTKDGQIGYIYSSLISQDRGATSLQPAASTPQPGQQAPALQTAAEKTKIPRSTPFDAQPKAAAAAQTQSTAPPASVQAAQVPAAPEQPPTADVAASVASAPTSSAIDENSAGTAAAVAQPASNAAVEPQPASAQSANAQPAAAPVAVFTAPPTAPATPNADAPETVPPATQPGSDTASAQPEAAQPAPAAAAPAQPPAAEPAAAKPVTPAVRPVEMKDSWEKPRPSVRSAPLLELYGGFAFSRMGGTGYGSNSIGGMGSVGWNAKSWLQVTADTSYNFETIGTTKNVLYGNHYGPRFFYRMRNRWGITPFGEALVGGSDLKTTVSGSGGYTASTGSLLSYKVGGGVDIHPSKRWEFRLIDVDYYRTGFGTNAHQTNYWISTGVVLRLFGGDPQ